MTNTNNIEFDAIHTAKKQANLKRMMEETAAEVLKLPFDSGPTNACPICHSKQIGHHSSKFGFNLDQCADCLQIFCNPMPSEQQLDRYYNSAMKNFENEFFLESFENRIPIFERRIQIIKQHIQHGRLLDVGSAIGIFIEALHRSQSEFEIHCCDPNHDACDKLKTRYPDATIHQTMVETLSHEQTFDLITMWDTLEHTAAPHVVAAGIKKLLRPGGYWFFSTPNTNSFEWAIAGKNHVQLLPPGHINLFNIKSINSLLEAQGFELVDYLTPNASLDISYVKKLLHEDSPQYKTNTGEFLIHQLENNQFSRGFAELLVENRLAGNILVVAKVAAQV